MSLPRQVLPGRTYMITRRCTQRQFLMRPDAETNNAFVYCLAEAAERFGIEVLFFLAMSNHHHTSIHDPLGNYPAFLEHFHKLFAKCQNALRGRWENFWSSEQSSVVRLQSSEDVLDKLVYALTNPVKDHLVERASEWPGASSLRAMLEGKALCAERPAHFFREAGPMPKTVTLRLARPAGFEGMTQDEWARLLADRVQAVERAARAVRREARFKVLGSRGVLRQDWKQRPASHEPRRQLSPTLAARSKWGRVEALLRNKAFQSAYAEARTAFVNGVRDVFFPQGTYWLRLFARVPCVGPPG
jgi:putative transposase